VPILITTAVFGSPPTACFSVIAMFEKSSPPSRSPIGGISTSPTKDETILPNAAPMMTPTARSTTLPRLMKSRNSFAMGMESLLRRLLFVAAILADKLSLSAAYTGTTKFREQYRQARSCRASVPEVAVAGEDHGEALVVGGLDHLVVAHRAAGLDHRGG